MTSSILGVHSKAWNGYHWARQANPFTVKLGNNLSSVWQQYLGNTSADWSQSTVLDTTIVAGQANPHNCRPTTGRDEVCNATYGNTGWLGIASIWITGGTHITQGTVKLNDTYFNTAKYNTFGWREMVTCQEVGHTFGLNHQDENFNNTNLGTCMDYTNDPTGTAGTNGTLANTSPNKHDYDQLVSIYSHLDSTTTVFSFPSVSAFIARPPADDTDFNNPAEWGIEVARSADGHLSIFERNLGDGEKLVTYVIWADRDDDLGIDRAPRTR
jgi:hypothetical protein